MRFDAIILGHVTIDVNVLPWGVIENVLGGAPTYAGLALAALKRNVGISSKIGYDLPEKFPPLFSKFGLDTEGVLTASEETTTFENTYDEDGNREQSCRTVAADIFPQDIPGTYRNARSYYISPVAGEVPPETIDELAKEDALVMLDPQGIFRNIGGDGKVRVEVPEDLEKYLANVDIVKIGMDELDAFKGSREAVLEELREFGPEEAILTLGKEGCLVQSEGEFKKIEGIDVEVKDLTGAGDVFGAAFLSNYLDTGDVDGSARFASVAAGLKLKYKGPVGFPSREEVEERL